MTESVVVLGPIPLAHYATAGTEEVPTVIESLCRQYKGALLANHGAITWAEDLTTAWYLMESIEQSADIYMKAKFILGNVNLLSKDDIEKLKRRYGIL